MHSEKKPLIVIVGPTAVGKTSLSIELAKHFNAEIISGDSMQVYRQMDIGTAKITDDEMQGIPHHMLNILSPDEAFNALKFKQLAQRDIAQIIAAGHLPMVVGGTGLYINGLIYDYGFHGDRDETYRNKIFEEMGENPDSNAYQTLIAARPDLEGVIFEKDRFRVSRALEIIRTNGKTSIKDFDMKTNYNSPYQLCLIGLNMDRAALYERINQRVDLMVTHGLVEEVEMLLQQGYNKEMQAMKAIGYKEIIAYLEGTLTLEEAVALLKKNTRHFAKRQLTWFRRDPNIKWFYIDEMSHEALFNHTVSYINQCLFPQ